MHLCVWCGLCVWYGVVCAYGVCSMVRVVLCGVPAYGACVVWYVPEYYVVLCCVPALWCGVRPHMHSFHLHLRLRSE